MTYLQNFLNLYILHVFAYGLEKKYIMKKLVYLICAIVSFTCCSKTLTDDFIQVSVSRIEAPCTMDSSASVTIKSSGEYSFELDSDWVSVESTETVNGDDVIHFKCLTNYTDEERVSVATVTLKSFVRRITFHQAARDYIMVKTNDSLYVYSSGAGKLYFKYKEKFIFKASSIKYEEGIWFNCGEEIWDDVKKITIEGIINAADFACIKHNFQNVEYIDIENTTIEPYHGLIGTMDWSADLYYEKDAIPDCAFWYGACWSIWDRPTEEQMYFGMLHLKEIKLPKTIKKVNFWSFTGVKSLKEIVIPEGVTSLGEISHIDYNNSDYSGTVFYNCWGLEKVYLPSTLKTIGYGSFFNTYNLKEVHIAAKEIPSETPINDLNLDSYPPFGTALDWCNMEDLGFSGSLMVGTFTPFIYIPETKATLYVPKGCKNNYKEWERYFQNIVEE